tara:strand:- start:698 stop:1222 length:525 start_codon:yes stop_codon:yes gene_type:complete
MMLGNYTVPNKQQRISISLRFEETQLGAQTSGTDTAHKGIKPKIINVYCLIPFVDVNDLTDLVSVAESVTSSGNKTIYDIVEPAANAMKVRQVQFTDTLEVREDYSLKAWGVSFALLEYKSVAEKTELRQPLATAPAQSAPGETVASGDDATEDEAAPVTGIERYLAAADKALS